MTTTGGKRHLGLEYRVAQAQGILDSYKGKYPLPFSTHLKQVFKQNSKWGSTDRRIISSLCYQYWRVGRLLEGKMICNPYILSSFYSPDRKIKLEAKEQLEPIIGEKLDMEMDAVALVSKLDPAFTLAEALQQNRHFLAGDFKNEVYFRSLFQQPFLWIKVQDDKVQGMLETLKRMGIAPIVAFGSTLAFENATNLTQTKAFKESWFRVQDRSSQQICAELEVKDGDSWWDVCAGSGGKSLGILDHGKRIKLYATDNRKLSLINYQQRLAKAGHSAKDVMVGDISQSVPKNIPIVNKILIDAPCSGSGTWARNPENIVHFKGENIGHYTSLQAQILRQAWSRIKADKGILYYVTCSIFQAENEDIIEGFLREQSNAELIKKGYVRGYLNGAENMFVASLRKKSE